MFCERIDSKQAVAFIKEFHYSGSCANGVARYGWFDNDHNLVGVSVFDNGNHQMRTGVFGPEYAKRVLHHHRLAVHPDVPHGTTSSFLAASLRALRKDRGTLAVVTYADSDQGHVGTIYQATNAIYTGMVAKGNLYFAKPDGSIGTMQSLKHVGTWSERRRVAAELGWQEKRCAGKHRYVYLLERRHPPLLWPTLPYPKKGDI